MRGGAARILVPAAVWEEVDRWAEFLHLVAFARRLAGSRKFIDWVRRRCGWKVTTTATAGQGFQIHPRRWVVERTFGWLVSYRRLGKDYKTRTGTSEAMIHQMLRRLPPPE